MRIARDVQVQKMRVAKDWDEKDEFSNRWVGAMGKGYDG